MRGQDLAHSGHPLADIARKGRAGQRHPNRGAGVVRHPAFVQRGGRLQVHSRRGLESEARGGISFVERGFPALSAVLREPVERRPAPHLRCRRGPLCNNAEKLAGRLVAELQFCTIDEIFDQGLHPYLDQLQSKLNNIGAALFDAYIFQQFNNLEGEIMVQQEEQQQQVQTARKTTP